MNTVTPHRQLTSHPRHRTGQGRWRYVLLLFVAIVCIQQGMAQAQDRSPSASGWDLIADSPGFGELRVGNFAVTSGYENFIWRGYAFRPARDLIVTGMYGGWGNPGVCTASAFYGAIYSASLTGGVLSSGSRNVAQVKIDQIITSVSFTEQGGTTAPTPGNEDFIAFDAPITLQRGALYVIAQGSADRGFNCHLVSTDAAIEQLVLGSPAVSEWLPHFNSSFRFNAPGEPTSREGVLADQLDAARVLLGFRYETEVTIPKFDETVGTGDGNAIDSERAVLSGILESSGAAGEDDVTTLFFQIGTTADLSGSDTRLLAATPSTITGIRTDFPYSVMVDELTAGQTYYFRSVGVNEAGRTNGPIKNFVQTPASGVSVVTALSNFGGSIHPEVRAVLSGQSTTFQLTIDPGYFISSTVTTTCDATVVSGGSFSGTTYTTGVIPDGSVCQVSFDFFQLRPEITKALPGTSTIEVDFTAPRIDEVPEDERPTIVRHEYSFDGFNWTTINAGAPEADPFTISDLLPSPIYNLRLRTIFDRAGTLEPSASSDVLPVVLFSGVDPYIITNRFQLNAVRFLLDKDFELANDIVFEPEDFELGGAFLNDGFLWEPIGSASVPFTGTFDGKGFSIEGVRTNRGLQDYVGLFGKIEGVDSLNKATIRKLSVSGNMSGFRFVGGIAGMISTNVVAERLFYNGTVTGISSFETRAGGITGVLASDLSHSGFGRQWVLSNGNKTGGLAGKLVDANISHSYVQGDVLGPTTSRGSFGGLVGYVQASSPVEISHSYFSGDLVTGNNNLAGFQGVGGLVGRMHNGGVPANTLTFTQVYAAGRVKTTTEDDANSGGLVGFDGGATFVVDGAFWDQEGTGQVTSGITGGTDTGTPIETTAQAKLLESYAVWGESGADIAETGDDTITESPWIIYNQASFPYLRSNIPDSIPGLDVTVRFASGSNIIWGNSQTWTNLGCPVGEGVIYPRASIPAAGASVILCDDTSLNIEADRSVSVSRLTMGAGSSIQILPFGTLTFAGKDLTTTLIAGSSITVNSNANALVQADKTLVIDEGASFTVRTNGYMASSGTVTGAVTHERQLSGPDRWLLLSSPVTGTRFAAESANDPLALLAPLFTRGFPGSDLPNAPARSANVLLYNESLSGDRSDRFAPPSTNVLPAGRGFMLRTSSHKPVDGEMVSIEYPLTLSVSGAVSAFNAQNQYTFPVSYSGDEPNDAESGWNLLGNPFGFALNWAATGTILQNRAWTNRQMLNGFIYLYNPDTQRYQVSSSTAATNDPNLDQLFSAVISPFQGFWVKANNSTSSVFQMGSSAFSFDRLNNTLFKNAGAGSSRPLAASGKTVLMRFSTPETDESLAMVRFDEQFTEAFGDDDAYFLTPLGERFAWLFTEKEGRATMINSQSFPADDARRIPLSLGGMIGEEPYEGEALLEWDLGDGLPSTAGVFLVDHEEGVSIDMRAAGEYRFTHKASRRLKSVGGREELQRPGTPVMASEEAGLRFEIVIDPSMSTGFTDIDLPLETYLAPNYPNPFNPVTTISYTLAEAGAVRLEVFTVTGQRVALLVNETHQSAGRHRVSFDATRLSSGVYVYRLSTGQQTHTRKMMLIK